MPDYRYVFCPACRETYLSNSPDECFVCGVPRGILDADDPAALRQIVAAKQAQKRSWFDFVNVPPSGMVAVCHSKWEGERRMAALVLLALGSLLGIAVWVDSRVPTVAAWVGIGMICLGAVIAPRYRQIHAHQPDADADAGEIVAQGIAWRWRSGRTGDERAKDAGRRREPGGDGDPRYNGEESA